MVRVNRKGEVEEDTWFRLSILPEMFYGVLNIITAFFQTMISDEATQQYTGRARVQSAAPRQGLHGFSSKGYKPDSNVPMAGG